jgi:4'-phosphopantetheinyl transferase EntD
MHRSSRDPVVESALASLAVPGIACGHRIIADGDEHALLASEMAAFAGSVVKVRRASGAARIVARELMEQLGHPAQAVPRSDAGAAPHWPTGLVGSLAHDASIAVAALASAADFMSIGIDIEPAQPLEPELLDVVATIDERKEIGNRQFGGRLLFTAKEAVYKAVYPLDHAFLDHHDVEVDLAKLTAVVRTGRTVPLRIAISNHIVALAFVRHRAD